MDGQSVPIVFGAQDDGHLQCRLVPYLDFWVDSQEECVEESEVISGFQSFGGHRWFRV